MLDVLQVKQQKKQKKTKTLKGNYQVEIKIKDYGTIYAEIDADTAPITVTNFVNLCKNHFYDGLTFHRIIKDFMIQGGDPNGDGTGGSEETIKGEFTDNGVENPLKHTRGALSMARSQDNDSASSQFFIVQKTASHLDGQYAVFGYVYEGMDIVDKICDDVQVEDNNGTVAKENQPVIESIRCQKIK
ncbi:peptidylprolyl isomerase [Faecalibacillus intestinalis]|uniref:peptidylprolyl isomerase n=1 Tax=Faecalibacillus intestinalis TaxID=1982626 RepID=UPI003522D27C